MAQRAYSMLEFVNKGKGNVAGTVCVVQRKPDVLEEHVSYIS
jgi:hypothetical protein